MNFSKKTLTTLLLILNICIVSNAQDLETGYRGFVDVAGGYGFSDAKDSWLISASTTHGYQLNQNVFIGGGVSPTFLFDSEDNMFFCPVYAAGRFDFEAGSLRPFIDTRIGYSVFDKIGFYAYGGVGLAFNKFSVSVGYTYQAGNVKKEYKYIYGDRINLMYAGIRLGYEF